jgi:hypothetical protein
MNDIDRYKDLDKLLRFYINCDRSIGEEPEFAAKAAGIKSDKRTEYLMCYLMYQDGYLSKSDEKSKLYYSNYRTLLFLDEGGYERKYHVNKRNKFATKMSDVFDIWIKPLTVASLITAIIWGIIRIYGELYNCS